MPSLCYIHLITLTYYYTMYLLLYIFTLVIWLSEQYIVLLQVIRQLSIWNFTLWGSSRRTCCPRYIYHTLWYDNPLFSLYSTTISPLAMDWMDTGETDTVSPTIHIIPPALSSILARLNIPLFKHNPLFYGRVLLK